MADIGLNINNNNSTGGTLEVHNGVNDSSQIFGGGGSSSGAIDLGGIKPIATVDKQSVNYDLDSVVKIIGETAGQKPKFDTKLGTDYLISNVELDTLLGIGFVNVGMTNRGGFTTPLYKLGNIEAIYIEQILCVYATK